jgi:hypothetical protein
MPAPGFLLHSTRHDGVVRLLNHGSDHQSDNSNKREAREAREAREGDLQDDPHYAKFAYSNLTGPGAAESSRRANIDSHIAVLAPGQAGGDGDATRRVRIERIAVAGRQASSRYRATRPDGEDCVVETTTVVRGSWEVRAHRVTAPSGTTVREGGYVIADDTAPITKVSAPVPWAFVTRPDGLASLVVGVHGWAAAAIRAEAEANALGPRSAVPYLVSAPRDATETIHVTLVVLTGEGIHPEALSTAVTAVVRGSSVLVSFPGETVELQVGAS